MRKHKIIFAVLYGAALWVACGFQDRITQPTVGKWMEALADVPSDIRTRNWQQNGFGSCAHASVITALRYRGEEGLARFWKAQYGGGEYENRLLERLDAAGIEYAYTTSGNILFLEYAARNRLVPVIWYFPAHAVSLVDLTPSEAVILDNNQPGTYVRIPRNQFIQKWRENYGGFAVVILTGKTPPPWPNWR